MNTESSESTDPTPRLRMQRVSKHFGATCALAGVDFEVRPGEVHALVGENGAGKSTLMKVLSGALSPNQGRMWLDGRPYRPHSPLAARRSGVAMIYQELSLAPHLSVMENILLGIEARVGPLVRWQRMRRQACQAMAQVGLESIAPETPVKSLALAQQQLVEIARAVAVRCRVLVLDEPTSSLTQHDTERLFALIEQLRHDGLGIVYISHFLEEVQRISDRFTVLRDGETVGTGTTAHATADAIVAQMVGRQVADLYPRSPRTPGETILQIDGHHTHEDTRSILTLRRGEILGIGGLVGAGRTELLRLLFGLDPVKGRSEDKSADSRPETDGGREARPVETPSRFSVEPKLGQITVAGYVGPASPARRWAQQVGLVSEDRKAEGLAIGLSIADNLTLPKLSGLRRWGLVTPSAQAAACRPWIDRLPIRCTSPGQRVEALSGGNQQKVALARLLHANVDVLLLDEPTRGIDVGAKAHIYRLLDDLACGDPVTGRPPKAILLVSSYLPELLGVCDRVAVMHRGRLSQPRPAHQWSEHELMMLATGETT